MSIKWRPSIIIISTGLVIAVIIAALKELDYAALVTALAAVASKLAESEEKGN